MDTDTDTDTDDAGLSKLSATSQALQRWKQGFVELTYLARQWQPSSKDQSDPPLYSFWMASSEVDQKFLGYFAKVTTKENNYLSSFLFRVLGLSVILAEKLLRARRAKRLDPVRDAKARHLIHHILWLAREGLIMVEQYVLPMVDKYLELKVLSYKLKASFYHIFVLFHNEPPVNDRINRRRSTSGGDGSFALFPDPLSPRESREERDKATLPGTMRSPTERNGGRKRSPAISTGRPMGTTTARTPPGLPLPATYAYFANGANGNGNGSATFLLPLQDYTPYATQAFREANDLAERLLPGSHPVRLSVKVEYVAYVYDCLHEAEASRRMARMSIRHVYEAQEGMDDDSFEDAAEMVGILGRMMKRGLGQGGSSGSQIRTEGQGGGGGRREQTQAQQPSTWV
ncbi:hypothetical protein H2200_008629 [Cladophialophora chaetospira]|uniref:14-3-3 domain-containing protein n=1 Tax=Cladophialophora chaetospira TaxID=386627 RepID=A0AA38X4F3_9EURO|nr:hypothetical protein H2200_008629 [Cladophialophora chaetospira]